MTRCILADDHPALLSAVGDYLASRGYDVVARAADGNAALRHVEREHPDVVLLDYRMPGCFGAELVARIKRLSPETRIAVYTAETDPAIVAETLAAGADAVVLKAAPLEDIVRALGAVEAGRPYVDPGLASDMRPAVPGIELTERERDVLRLLAEGLPHEEIGARLEIAAETVRTHSRKAADRLGARTRTQAVASAIRLGLI